jgi:hypothetical protein
MYKRNLLVVGLNSHQGRTIFQLGSSGPMRFSQIVSKAVTVGM